MIWSNEKVSKQPVDDYPPFRVALSNNRIVKVENEQIIFCYDDHKDKRCYCTLPAEKFTVGIVSYNTSCPRAFKRSAIMACSALLHFHSIR